MSQSRMGPTGWSRSIGPTSPHQICRSLSSSQMVSQHTTRFAGPVCCRHECSSILGTNPKTRNRLHLVWNWGFQNDFEWHSFRTGSNIQGGLLSAAEKGSHPHLRRRMAAICLVQWIHSTHEAEFEGPTATAFWIPHGMSIQIVDVWHIARVYLPVHVDGSVDSTRHLEWIQSCLSSSSSTDPSLTTTAASRLPHSPNDSSAILTTLHPNDVLFTGGKNSHHFGNQLFRSLVFDSVPLYYANDTDGRDELVHSIIQQIHDCGGRFLKSSDDKRWQVVPMEELRTKIMQTFISESSSAIRSGTIATARYQYY